jgi:signal transduction histidine kinase
LTAENASQALRVSITKESSIEDVRLQAERVVDRLRQVGTELQSARKEVIRSDRLAAVGELAAGVAHELRNPLTSVKLLLQHVSKRASGFSIGESQLRLILEEVGRMEGTIEGLLDFSRTPTLNRIRHDLRETLRRSLNLVDGRLKQGRIELLTDLSTTPLWIDADAEQLNQVFVNLLLNSVEAMPNGGQLHITAVSGAEGKTVRVTVADTGEGIASDVMPRLFEPFATSKERGTGLGLAISRRIVTDHSGTISAANCPDRGAKFIVELPFCSGTET